LRLDFERPGEIIVGRIPQSMQSPVPRVLVAGWFSFEDMHPTAGDVIARDVVCGWLREGCVDHDVALPSGVTGGVDWQSVEPTRYTHVAFVCGPFLKTWPVDEFLQRFDGARLIGLNLSMLSPQPFPFHLLLERDSPRTARPDLAFGGPAPRVPVVGLVLASAQPEYAERSRHAEAEALIATLSGARSMSLVPIDTVLPPWALAARIDPHPVDRPRPDGLVRLLLRHGARLAADLLPSRPARLARRLAAILAPGVNTAGLRTAAEVEALLARMDAVVTTRLHGLVLALKNGVPTLALDPIRGGAKLSRQAAALGWPHALTVDEADADTLTAAFDRCLAPEARALARECARRAVGGLAEVRERLLSECRPDTDKA
jgi:Polysaccharide pyruvyl transferase